MFNFGRLELKDSRDMHYGIAPLLKTPKITERFWWDNGWWGDQGRTSRCVSFSWQHWLEDGPVIQDRISNRPKPLFDLDQFYHTCKTVDGFDGVNYEGTTVRAGAKVLKDTGLVMEYRWAFTVDEIILTLLSFGPMVVGTLWTDKMQHPDSNGLIRASGKRLGGHAYVINGVDTNKEYFRIKNSWGRNWGDGGRGYISFSDFERVFKDGGEACIANEVKINEMPNLEWVKPLI